MPQSEPGSPLHDQLRIFVEKTMRSYEAQPSLIEEHGRLEEGVLSGGYGHRQLFELIQNGADAIRETGSNGRVEVVLTTDCLYCANEGNPIDESGLRALLMAHLSSKKGDEIGRFGLGFKSVLAISDSPQLFSSTINLAFNPPGLMQELKRLAKPEWLLPRLRIASPVDRKTQKAGDPVLSGLLNWATTVVRLPLVKGAAGQIAEDMKTFPQEFLVFSPHVETLTLDNRIDGSKTTLKVSRKKNGVRINSGGSTVRWLVSSLTIPASDLPENVVADMDVRLRDRQSIPIQWAVVDGPRRRERGRFWAFFPTQTETTASGILNAPWKTNSDRENLLDGAFNRYLLDRAAGLIADNITACGSGKDPALFLDMLPARETAGWADACLSEKLATMLSSRPCIPTVGGGLGLPSNTTLRPSIGESARYKPWFEQYGMYEPRKMAHLSVESRDRRNRAERLGCPTTSLRGWIGSILPFIPTELYEPGVFRPANGVEKVPQRSIALVCLAKLLLEDPKASKENITMLMEYPFLLTREDKLVCPDKSHVFFDDKHETEMAYGAHVAHHSLTAFQTTRSILQNTFKLVSIGLTEVLSSMLHKLSIGGSTSDWSRFWTLQRHATDDQFNLVRREHPETVLKVKTLSGEFKQAGETMLVGSIVDESVTGQAGNFLVDPVFHQQDLSRLEYLGVSDQPRMQSGSGSLFMEYLDHCRNAFRSSCAGGKIPNSSSLMLQEEVYLCRPLELLHYLQGAAAVRMTKAILPHAIVEKEWVLKHDIQTNSRGTRRYPGLMTLTLKQHGWLETNAGPLPVKECLSPSLKADSSFLPVAHCSAEESELLCLPASLASIPQSTWTRAVEQSLDHESGPGVLGDFYGLAAEHLEVPPEIIRALSGDVWITASPAEVAVATAVEDFEFMRRQERPAILVTNQRQASVLASKWKMVVEAPPTLVFEPASEPKLAVNAYPRTQSLVQFPANLVLQSCSKLALEIRRPESGLESTPADDYYRAGVYYYLAGDENDSFFFINRMFCTIGFKADAEVIHDVVNHVEEQLLQSRIDAIKRATTIHEKLVAAIGSENLRAGIPRKHLDGFPQVRTDHDIANLALACHGVMTLKVYADELTANGLKPPRQWTGGEQAVAFVRDLGFPEEYAGFQGVSRRPWEDVHGPIKLPPLHDYQRTISEGIIAFLKHAEPGRGLLSLPTGAGKTRVTVESIISWMRDTTPPPSVLWIAQSDELCEQAVVCWMDAWRALGPENVLLRVNRLWGENNDRVDRPDSGASVVVATYQTLSSRLADPNLSWVYSPCLVVIDEAHGSTEPSYTNIFNRMGLDHKKTSRRVIGLTATPFRGGKDSDETERLAMRYDQTRFDHGLGSPHDLYRLLQERHILSLADHAELEGEEMELTADELAHLEQYKVLPPTAEERLRNIKGRNDRIIEHIKRMPADWPILLFASSTRNAEDMAVALNMCDIPAQYITGDTPIGVRRHSIGAFKDGRIRVLTNFGVLTTGFDAPRVRALYITRPVYSPGLYQQMIGRGLRGPANGGTDRCLIVNVKDNISNFGTRLAFTHFEHLWQKA